MMRVSRTKTEEVIELKRKHDSARLAVKRGRQDYQQNVNLDLRIRYLSGALEETQEEAEAAYAKRKVVRVAMRLGPRMGESYCSGFAWTSYMYCC